MNPQQTAQMSKFVRKKFPPSKKKKEKKKGEIITHAGCFRMDQDQACWWVELMLLPHDHDRWAELRALLTCELAACEMWAWPD